MLQPLRRMSPVAPLRCRARPKGAGGDHRGSGPGVPGWTRLPGQVRAVDAAPPFAGLGGSDCETMARCKGGQGVWPRREEASGLPRAQRRRPGFPARGGAHLVSTADDGARRRSAGVLPTPSGRLFGLWPGPDPAALRPGPVPDRRLGQSRGGGDLLCSVPGPGRGPDRFDQPGPGLFVQRRLLAAPVQQRTPLSCRASALPHVGIMARSPASEGVACLNRPGAPVGAKPGAVTGGRAAMPSADSDPVTACAASAVTVGETACPAEPALGASWLGSRRFPDCDIERG